MSAEFQIGDRWIETTFSGHTRIYRVAALNVKPKHQHHPGNCIRLVPVKHGGAVNELVMWPQDILAVDWMRKDEDPS